jgi:membrane-bound lytic murein transglycosylase A
MTLRSLSIALALLAAAGCSRVVPRPETPPPVERPVPQPPQPQPTQPQPEPPAPPPPATALEAGLAPGPAYAPTGEAAERAWRAFRISCPSLLTREDASGLTRGEHWRPLCEESARLTTPDAMAAFFRDRFELVQVGDGAAFATGYYEPEIRGSRVRLPGYDTPVYSKPPELLDVNPLTGARGRGRIDETGQYVL